MYCTLEDLLAQVPERTLIELTSEEMDFDSPATVNTRVVDSCIRYADEQQQKLLDKKRNYHRPQIFVCE